MRILIGEREHVVNDHIGHYEKLLEDHPTFVIETGFGLPELRALKQRWLDERAALGTLADVDLPSLRFRRDAIFGTSARDANGLWFRFINYKPSLNLRRDVLAELRAIVPNVGRPSAGNYATIAARFREHWELLDDSLPPAQPFVVGDFVLATMQAKEAELRTLVTEIDEADSTQSRLVRAKVEKVFGDVPAARRDPDSVIARLIAYRVLVTTNFSGTDPDLVELLPELFPGQSEDEPTFRFNFAAANGDVTVWWEIPDEISDATQLYLKEGAEERILPLPIGAQTLTFLGVSVEGGLDGLELRDSEGRTLADGVFDETLAAP